MNFLPCPGSRAQFVSLGSSWSLSWLLAALGLVGVLTAPLSAQERKEPNRGGTVDLSTQDPAVAAKRFKLAPGYAVNLFASEKEFPELANPVAMTFDARGRLWVATMPTYPQYKPPTPPNDKIIVLEDTNGDGKADKVSTFADGLHLPTGLELGHGGLYVASQPNLLFLKDTDGDDKADEREMILHGLGSEDSHHAIHAFFWGPDGGLYFHEGTFHASQIETPYGVLRLSNAGAFRLFPRTWETTVFVSYPFANPWGHVFDRWGQNFIADASGGQNYFGSAMSGRVIYPDKHVGQKTFIPFSVRPTGGCVLVSSGHFPPEAQGNFLFNNCIGFQGVKQYKVAEEGSGFTGEMIEDLVDSSDPNFRPVAIRFAPDGSLFLVDWFNPLVGHMQYSLRDERRDHSHGRIWRVTYPARPLVKPPTLAGASTAAVLDALLEYEDDARYRARRELNERNRDEVVPALNAWLRDLDPQGPDYEHDLLEGLWVYQSLNVVNDVARALLDRLLDAKEPRARAAATRALRFWLNRVPDPLALLRKQIADDFPRARLEALLTLSFFDGERGAAAAEIALQALSREPDDESKRDYYVNYVLGETLRTLGPSWKPAIARGQPFAAGNPRGLAYALNQLSVAELTGAARSQPVFAALLTREGVEAKFRREALSGLARLNSTSELKELEAALGRATGGAQADLAQLLAQWPTNELAGVRGLIERLATKDKDSNIRQAGFAAMLRADGAIAGAWNLAANAPHTLNDLLDATALINDPKLLGEFYPKTLPLLTALSPGVATHQAGAVPSRFVRIELPGQTRTLTLAEVQVFSNGRNVASTGRASQSATALNRPAELAIDGKTGGSSSAGTHASTPEDQTDPWWELDLGREHFVNKLTIWNRTDSGMARRLEGFRLRVLDGKRREVFAKEENPAPEPSATIELSGDPLPVVRRAAINALGRIPGHDMESFSALSALVVAETDPAAALASLAKLNRDAWPKKNFESFGQAVAGYAARVPVADRDTPEFAAVLELGRYLAKFLPGPLGEKILATLKSVEVQRVVIQAAESRMRFDVTHFYVEAGRPVEIVFENPDEMPHNLLIVAPGAMEETGQLADTMGGGGFAKNFVPDSKKVLHATKLVAPKGGMEKLRFPAPSEPGDYPYLCSFPAHWLTMNGVMTVVKPGDAKAGEIVRGKPPGEALPPIAELLTMRGNADAGKAVFTRTCAICHKLGDTGVNFAPHLNQIAARLTREQIIKSILEPGAEITKGNETVTIEAADGETYTGLIGEETVGQIKLRVGADAVQTIPKAAILKREIAKNSGMPLGLEQAMSRQEFVDLIEFLAAQK